VGNSFSEVGVQGESDGNDGVAGGSEAEGRSGVFGHNTRTEGLAGNGVFGWCDGPNGSGVQGVSKDGLGVKGVSTNGVGVNGVSSYGDGVLGDANSHARSGVYGRNLYSTGRDELVRPGAELSTYGVTGQADDVSGVGVHGISRHGCGATFQGGRAPLRLLPAETAGAPASGNHEVGELFVDSHGDLFFCKVTGTPGTWVKIA
jgi:hypothetical protein